MRVMMYVYFSGRQEAKGMKANGAMSGRHDGETPASNVFFFFWHVLLWCTTFGHNGGENSHSPGKLDNLNR